MGPLDKLLSRINLARVLVWRQIYYDKRGIEPDSVTRLSGGCRNQKANTVKGWLGFSGIGGSPGAVETLCYPCFQGVRTYTPCRFLRCESEADVMT